jgi:hypothetical protein
MKQFFIFLIIFVILITGFFVFSHFYLEANSKKIIIAIDSSFTMNSSWSQVLEELAVFEKYKYTSFALITDKVVIHTWDKELKPYKIGNIKPYGPRDLTVFLDSTKFPEIKKADQIIILTNETDLSIFSKDQRYKIIRLN